MIEEDVLRYSEDLPNKKLRVAESQSSFSLDKASLKNLELLQFLITKKLRCGLSLSIKIAREALSEKEFILELEYDFNRNEIKEFLSRELNVEIHKIFEGKISD